MRTPRRVYRIALIVSVVGLSLGFAGTAFAADRVAANPNTFTLAEGASTDVEFFLLEPIIALTPDPTVVLTFTVDDPSRISVSPDSLEWAASEWTQTRMLHVTAIHD